MKPTCDPLIITSYRQEIKIKNKKLRTTTIAKGTFDWSDPNLWLKRSFVFAVTPVAFLLTNVVSMSSCDAIPLVVSSIEEACTAILDVVWQLEKTIPWRSFPTTPLLERCLRFQSSAFTEMLFWRSNKVVSMWVPLPTSFGVACPLCSQLKRHMGLCM